MPNVTQDEDEARCEDLRDDLCIDFFKFEYTTNDDGSKVVSCYKIAIRANDSQSPGLRAVIASKSCSSSLRVSRR